MTTSPTTAPIHTNVIDVEPEPELAEPAPATLAVIDGKMNEQQVMKLMAHHGMIVPISTPEGLRHLYATRQKMYAAILDENDYLWIVKFKGDKGGGRQYIAANKKEAEERAEALHGDIMCKPTKSGVQKLAEALGITSRCVIREERTYNRTTIGIYCEYEAKHELSGKIESGVGFCGKDERYGKISIHEMITTADTRAYCRAVLRLSAFGDVSAEEIISGVGTTELPEYVPEASPNKAADPLPDEQDDDVLTAWRIYYESVMARDAAKRFLSDAKQETLDARIVRAAARRGDPKSARKLGTLGLKWSGSAQDSSAHQTFEVAIPSQEWLDAVRTSAEPEAAPAAEEEEKEDKLAAALAGTASPPPPTNGNKEGWDLSGNGKKDDADLPADLPERHEPKAGIPEPHPSAETITIAQAKRISKPLIEKLGSKEAAKEWVKTECHVDKSVEIRSNQYEAIMTALGSMKKKED